MRLIFFTILFHFTFVAHNIYGCTLASTPLTDFDETEYIFIGEVIGYAEPLNFNRKLNHTDSQPNYEIKFSQANGLIVKVKDSVNLPKTPKTHFEVFPFDLGSTCGTLGLTKPEIENRFPLNSEILAVVSEASKFPHTLSDGNFRLEERKAHGFVALNLDKANKRLSSIETVFDYKTNATNQNYFALKFEIRKDLLRLKNAKTQKEREEVANRILYSYKSYRFVDLYSVFKKYIPDSAQAKELYRKHLQFSEFSEKIIQEEIENRHKLEQKTHIKKN